MFLLSVSKDSYAGSVAELSAIAEISRVGSWQPEHWSVVEVWQEVRAKLATEVFLVGTGPQESVAFAREGVVFSLIGSLSWVELAISF
jgi:hypothetical protein